ncbi:MAG: hypothetical protein JJT94_03720 [Bernardetiaceae bacterium]|nr:hypothetical protein [Bernardetiaceae bacterium]
MKIKVFLGFVFIILIFGNSICQAQLSLFAGFGAQTNASLTPMSNKLQSLGYEGLPTPSYGFSLSSLLQSNRFILNIGGGSFHALKSGETNAIDFSTINMELSMGRVIYNLPKHKIDFMTGIGTSYMTFNLRENKGAAAGNMQQFVGSRRNSVDFETNPAIFSDLYLTPRVQYRRTGGVLNFCVFASYQWGLSKNVTWQAMGADVTQIPETNRLSSFTVGIMMSFF